jgi:hypothetical protein
MKVTEQHIQAILMNYLMNQRHHDCVIPNSTTFFSWEADVISITKARLVHEFEIKLNMADFKRDAQKEWKHSRIGSQKNSPAYFWYATFEFEINPPPKAGWILVKRNEKKYGWVFNIEVKKDAPRLNTWKPEPYKIADALRLVSFRLAHFYYRDFMNKVDGE